MDGDGGSARQPGATGGGDTPPPDASGNVPVSAPDDLAAGVASTTDGEAAAEPLTPEEFEQMVLEIHRPLFATALRLSRRRAEAEDLVQETLYRGFRSLRSFRRGSRFRAWMFRILHNVFINRVRREGKAPSAVDPADLVPADHDHPVPGILSMDELPDLADRHFDERVKNAVDSLSENFRVPLVLFALGDLSYQEIADTLGIPIGTVMSRLHRARRHVRGELAEYAAEHGLTGRGGGG